MVYLQVLLVTGKMYATLRRLGFDAVFDTNFAADLTIMEEGTELISRIKTGGVLPLITSCCPGWVKFAEHNYAGLLPNISTCKSPQQMFGALVKTYYAQQKPIDPETIASVSIMPCTAKNLHGFFFPYAFYGAEEYGSLVRKAGLVPKRVELIPKTMLARGKEGLAAWIRTTWLPYTQRVPEEMREEFIREIVAAYETERGIDAKGFFAVGMVRLEVEAVGG